MEKDNGAWKERFIEELRVCGVVQDACAAAGMCKATAYKARRRADSFATKWDDALAEAMERMSLERMGGGKRVKRLAALPRGMWQGKFIEELRRSGSVGDACIAANITKQTAYYARRKSIAQRARGEIRADDAFASHWDAAILEAVEADTDVQPLAASARLQRRPRVPHGSWHDKFLAELRVCGIVKEAARAAHVDPNTVYAARRKALRMRAAGAGETEDFSSKWDEAIEEAVERLEQEVWRRGVDGDKRPVFYRGRRVGHIKRYSDKLLILLLKAHRPKKYRDNAPQIVGSSQ